MGRKEIEALEQVSDNSDAESVDGGYDQRGAVKDHGKHDDVKAACVQCARP